MCFPAFIYSSHASPAVPLAPFIARWIASVDMGGSEHCPAWPMYTFVAWLSCWDSTSLHVASQRVCHHLYLHFWWTYRLSLTLRPLWSRSLCSEVVSEERKALVYCETPLKNLLLCCCSKLVLGCGDSWVWPLPFHCCPTQLPEADWNHLRWVC